MRGDGNHTLYGALAAKHAIDIPVARVPYDVHKDLSLSELKGIGNLMNKRPEITKKEMDVKDGTKHIIDNYYANGVPVESNSNIDWLKAYGFTGGIKSGQILTSMNKAKDKIELDDMAQNNELFCNYKAAPHNKALEDTVEAFQDSKTVATYTSSGHVPADRILEKLNSAKKIGKTTFFQRLCLGYAQTTSIVIRPHVSRP